MKVRKELGGDMENAVRSGIPPWEDGPSFTVWNVAVNRRPDGTYVLRSMTEEERPHTYQSTSSMNERIHRCGDRTSPRGGA